MLIHKVFYVLVSFLLISACSISEKDLRIKPTTENSIAIKLPRSEVFKITERAIKELDLKIVKSNSSEPSYILAENEISLFYKVVFLWYANWGSNVVIRMQEKNNETLLWVESKRKFWTVGSLFEKDWGIQILNYVSYESTQKRINEPYHKSYIASNSQTLPTKSIQTKNSCLSNNDWTRTDNRTQAGGVIWFLGKSTSKELKKAYLEAEGMALHRLVQECSAPHFNTRIIERCDDQLSDGRYIAYVRANLKELECRKIREANDKSKKEMSNPFLLNIIATYGVDS